MCFICTYTYSDVFFCVHKYVNVWIVCFCLCCSWLCVSVACVCLYLYCVVLYFVLCICIVFVVFNVCLYCCCVYLCCCFDCCVLVVFVCCFDFLIIFIYISLPNCVIGVCGLYIYDCVWCLYKHLFIFDLYCFLMIKSLYRYKC